MSEEIMETFKREILANGKPQMRECYIEHCGQKMNNKGEAVPALPRITTEPRENEMLYQVVGEMVPRIVTMQYLGEDPADSDLWACV